MFVFVDVVVVVICVVVVVVAVAFAVVVVVVLMHGYPGSQETCVSRVAEGSTRKVLSELTPASTSTRGFLRVRLARA